MNQQIEETLSSYFHNKPVEKAWVFGSFSRGEERPDSDVDILVSFDRNARVTLLTMGGMYSDLTQLLNRKVDLVEEGTLLPFARESAERDKKLIYERS